MAKIHLGVCQSTGTILKEAHVRQHNYPQIEILDDNHQCIVTVAMTFEQLAQMLVSQSEVTCTLQRYIGPNGIEKEEVEPPKTIRERADETFGSVHTELAKRMKALHDRVYDTLNIGKAGKHELKAILQDVDVIYTNFRSNHGYILEKTQEEVDSMRDNMVTQIKMMTAAASMAPQLAQSIEDSLPQLSATKDNNLVTQATQPVPVPPSDYKKAIIPPEKMTNLELSDNISKELKRFEAMRENHENDLKHGCILFWSSASESPKGVHIIYINYQGGRLVEHDVAVRYLKFLRAAKTFKEFKTHYWFEKEQ